MLKNGALQALMTKQQKADLSKKNGQIASGIPYARCDITFGRGISFVHPVKD